MKINSNDLQSFFYGTLLGDSYFSHGSFCCKQISKDLIVFKKKIIEQYLPNVNVKFTSHEGYVDKNGVHHKPFFTLSANGSEYLKKMEKLFYPNGKKICPKGVISKLTPIGLAMWYADDGTTVLVQKNETTGGAKSRRVQICTDSFSLQEHQQIIVPELKKLGFESTIVDRARKEQVRIQIPVKLAQKFILTIGDYFCNYFPSLSYKMDLGYRGNSLLNRRYVTEEYFQFYSKLSACPDFTDRMLNR